MLRLSSLLCTQKLLCVPQKPAHSFPLEAFPPPHLPDTQPHSLVLLCLLQCSFCCWTLTHQAAGSPGPGPSLRAVVLGKRLAVQLLHRVGDAHVAPADSQGFVEAAAPPFTQGSHRPSHGSHPDCRWPRTLWPPSLSLFPFCQGSPAWPGAHEPRRKHCSGKLCAWLVGGWMEGLSWFAFHPYVLGLHTGKGRLRDVMCMSRSHSR